MRELYSWITTLFSGKPHFVIGSPGQPYMLRWYLIPRNHLINVYLHKFLRSDDDRAKHDHPWFFISLMIRGKYYEQLDRLKVQHDRWRYAPSIAVRWPSDRHIVTLAHDDQDVPVPCWTIVVTGPKFREWGFWCPKGFVPWHQFVDHSDHGNIGKGCGE